MSEVNKTEQNKGNFEQFLDKHFEPKFFALRYIIFIPVMFSFLGAIMMIVVGSFESIEALHATAGAHFTETTILLIKAIDAFLLSIVLLIFSYGMYDLFISKLDVTDDPDVRPNWLHFEDLGQLKILLAEVILIILTISFFEVIVVNIHNFEDNFDQVWAFLVIPLGALLISLSIGLFKKYTHNDH